MRFSNIVIILLLTYYILHTTYYIPSVSATCQTQSSNPRVQNGLISANSISGNFGNTGGNCVTGTQAPFAPFKIPSYEDLKSLYYAQSKATKNPADSTTTVLSSPTVAQIALTANTVYNFTHSSGVSIGPFNYTYSGAVIIFIDNKLSITGDITGTSSNGLVFVVGDDVNIAQSVTRIDAVIISQGTICTAYDGSSCPTSNVPLAQLTINGSLVSLGSASIQFRRTLTGAGNNSQAAEVINQQPKYLVILRHLFSDTLQKWSEVQ